MTLWGLDGGDWLHLLVLLPISSWPRRCWSFTVVPMNVFPVDMHMNTKTYLLSGILFLNHVRSVKRNPPPPHPLETLGMNHFCASCSFSPCPWCFPELDCCALLVHMWYVNSFVRLFVCCGVELCNSKGHVCVPCPFGIFSFFMYMLLYMWAWAFVWCVCVCVCARLLLEPSVAPASGTRGFSGLQVYGMQI